MAQKVPPPAPPAPAVESGADEIAVLFPDQTITIGGTRLTVREFRHLEGLEVLSEARPLLEDLRAVAETGGSLTTGRALNDVKRRHAKLWIALEARACDRDPAWVAGLRQADAAKLEGAFWKANGFFLTSQLLHEAALDYLAAKASRSGTSSSSSSPADSDAINTISPGASPGASSVVSGN